MEKLFIDTKISVSVRDLVNWNLRWAIVDTESKLLKPVSLETVVTHVQKVRAERNRLIHDINVIFNYPSRLREEIQALPSYQELEDTLNLAIASCKKRELTSLSNYLQDKLG